jgi:restriction endonuclease S subunit
MQYSVVRISKVLSDSDCLRYDAEFFKPEYLEIESKLKKPNFKTLKEFGIKIYHPNEIKREYTFGQCCLYLLDDEPIASSHSFIVRSGILHPAFLAVFLNSRYGRNLLNKGMYGGVQPEIAPFYIYNIPIPSFSDKFQKKFNGLYNDIENHINNSKSLYQQAENLLLEELGLKDFQPKHQLFYIKNYSDTKKAERFDAEYFQPQYEEILKKIQNYNQNRGINKEIILDDIVKWSKGVEVGTEQYVDEGFDFIRISDFSTKGISETSKKISKELFVKLKAKYSPRKGDILFTKDGTIGLTYLVDQNQDSIVSGAFLKLRPKIEIEAEYLTLVLNSVICKKQIEMMSGGAIIAHLKPSDAMNLQIPVLSSEKQKDISLKIVDSKEKDKQSKSLLEIAKKAVEMAIEDNEEKATNWIDQELEKLGV